MCSAAVSLFYLADFRFLRWLVISISAFFGTEAKYCLILVPAGMSISQIFLATHDFSVKFRHRSLYSQYSRPRKSPKPSKNSSELLFFHHILKNPVFHGRKFLICKLLYLLFPKPAQIFFSQGCRVPLQGMYILTKPASVPKRQFDLNSCVPKLRKSSKSTCNPPLRHPIIFPSLIHLPDLTDHTSLAADGPAILSTFHIISTRRKGVPMTLAQLAESKKRRLLGEKRRIVRFLDCSRKVSKCMARCPKNYRNGLTKNMRSIPKIPN